MNLRIQNQLNSIGACINVANIPEFKLVWNGQVPVDFTTDLAQIATGYGAVTAKAAQAEAATGGAGDAKALAESALEDAAFVMARALANHFKKTGDLDKRGKVDFTKTDIVKLRMQDLVNTATAIRDLATAAAGDAGAAGRGVTAAHVATLTAAIEAFSKAMGLARGEVVNRSTLLKDVETDTAELLDALADASDLVLQFGGTDAGLRFIAAWKQARMILDLGHSPAATPAPATATAQAAASPAATPAKPA